jgi:hypothetical protein
LRLTDSRGMGRKHFAHGHRARMIAATAWAVHDFPPISEVDGDSSLSSLFIEPSCS